MIWPVLRLVWESRGQKMESVSEDLKKALPGHSGLSVPTLTRMTTKSKDEAPPEVAAVIHGLTVLPGYEETAEVVSRGLMAMETGSDVDVAAVARQLAAKLPKVEPEVVAAAVVAKLQAEPEPIARALMERFPADELALKLAEALTKQAELWAGAGSLFDVFAKAVADRLPRMPKLREAKIARQLARNLERLSWKRIAVAGAAGGVVACIVGLVFLAVAGHSNGASAPPPSPPPATAPVSASSVPPIIIVMNGGTGAAPFVFEYQTLLGALATGELGKKAQENWIPSGPLPGQKVPPCDAGLGESAISGGCWGAMADVQPPCGRLFRSGDKCYRPIAADPTKPVGLPQEAPGQGQRLQ